MRARSGAGIALATFLAACSGGVAGGGGKSADWAMDACKTFPADLAGKAAGVAIAKAEGPGQTGSQDILVSNCNYSSADGTTNFGVLLRQARSGGETIDAQIAAMRTGPEITGTLQDVPMPKGKALWSDSTKTLTYVPADGRMIVVTPPGAYSFGTKPVPVQELKAKAIAIANAIEG